MNNLKNSLIALERHVVEGVPKDEPEIREIVEFLDNQTQEMSRNASSEQSETEITLMLPTGDELTAEVSKILDESSTCPQACLPLAVSWMLRSFINRVKKDLNVVVREIRFASRVHFSVSFSMFGFYVNYSKSPEERKRIVDEAIERMRKSGFKIEDHNETHSAYLGGKVLPFYPNASILEHYFSFLGASDITIETRTGCISKVSGFLDPSKYPVETQIQEPECASNSKSLTEADVYRIKRAIDGYEFALSIKETVADKYFVYGLFWRYMAEIEYVLGFHDFPLLMMVEKKCKETQKKNREATEYMAESGRLLFEKEREDLVPYLSLTIVKMNKLLSPLGLCCFEERVGVYGALSFCVTTDPSGLKTETTLDGHWDDNVNKLLVKATPENLEQIRQTIHIGLPMAKIDEIVSDENGMLKNLRVVTSSLSDVLHLNKTVDVEW